ncbi:translation initiation factor IF-3 [Salinibacter ruber]|uniref:Translation initiation factor IF-3 n=1 Tax=Salinibacter ruber TaxID=146919 RepID=A0A9X2UKH0_9BACT|nr:translation initiation factor IF-3 [Salinibacter ruber]MBB4089648.1 translation initiation factor IF-3 [Salinibacter ruber]MCS3610474.1 translation initiation factor IF-3 [Salinibacter ruber]MCS3614682.1 translation initiation factor IF-3 [Salinibacter ruber]MCS3645592.1 translation initiation factor IF-3 [Salinibacter ruber]MCS3673365.1 translation initiation factor IF-3 [Salinibacter ruber]
MSTRSLVPEPSIRSAQTEFFTIPEFSSQKTTDPAIADVDKLRVNQEIRADEVRVVEPDGDHDVVPTGEALDRARDHELDLVEVAPDADPPVCKILDYGKYRYEKQKEEQRRRKKSKSMEMKELRFRPRTEEHDFNFKVDHAREFLEDGNKVKAYVQFKGRDIVYKDQGMDLLRRMIEELQEIARIDQQPEMEGRRMVMILAPHKNK